MGDGRCLRTALGATRGLGRRNDRGSTLPLILGFFLIAMLVVAGSIAADDAALDQNSLQSGCDSTSLALVRPDIGTLRGGGVLDASLTPSGTAAALSEYTNRDPHRATIDYDVTISADRRSLVLHCAQELPVTFGWLFGRANVRHNVYSPANAPSRV